MSEAEDDREKDPDFEPDFSTVEMADLRAGGSDIVGEGFNSEGGPMPSGTTDVEDDGEDKYIVGRSRPGSHYKPKPKKDRRTSLIWTKFTIINKKEQIAACNICDQRMSIRSTSGNLKKHLERKHGFSIQLGVLPGKRAPPKYITPTPRPNMSQLSGISEKGITVKVVGEDGEEEHFQVLGDQFMAEEVVGEVQEHDYSTLEHQEEGEAPDQLRIGKVRSLNETRSSHSRRDVFVPQRSYSHMDEKAKRKRIMELQMDCLENKKYNMQLEALLMEQQLGLPRSIFTQPLRFADTQTRSTQTEVGGSDTRVFYITDKRGGRPMQQLFAFQDLEDF